jgi:putative resolvase
MSPLSIGAASALLGVAVSTLRRWNTEGRLFPAFRTPGGHRRYAWVDLQRLISTNSQNDRTKRIIGYARVSSHGQKADLGRQAERLRSWCRDSLKGEAEIIQDLGSGLNYRKSGLRKLLRLISLGEFDHLVLTHKDRLLRFGSELLFELCQLRGIQVTVIEADTAASYEQQLSADVIELMTVFSARLYGRRSHQNRKKTQKEA